MQQQLGVSQFQGELLFDILHNINDDCQSGGLMICVILFENFYCMFL